MPVDGRSMATRLQLSGQLNVVDIDLWRRRQPQDPQGRIKGAVAIDWSHIYSPKGLLVGKYIFLGNLEENSWDNRNSRPFWRCETLGLYSYGEGYILDWEILNISTLLASESVFLPPEGGRRPIGLLSDQQKFQKLIDLKANVVEVVKINHSSQYQDYYPVEWKFASRKNFSLQDYTINKTSTLKKYEEINNIDFISRLTF